jgi:hypothetical protein
MNVGVALVPLLALFSALQLGSEQPGVPASIALDAPSEPCAAAHLMLTSDNERLQMGAYILAGDVVRGGPASCVASASSDSPNAKASLSTRHDVATVLILAQHPGFANVSVFAADGALIGVIRVSVYPREYPSKKH